MKGFFNLFSNAKKAIDIKAQKKADEIEDKNIIEFSKQDIEKIENDLRESKKSIGIRKGEIISLEDKITTLDMRIKKYDENAKSLMVAGNDELAEKNANEAEKLEIQKRVLNSALIQQKELLEKQNTAKEKLENGLNEAKNSFETMKAMNAVATTNEKISSVTIGDNSSTLSKFKDRQEKIKKKMIISESMVDESSSVEEETAKVLNINNGRKRLERLKPNP